jgi:YqjK-like protein
MGRMHEPELTLRREQLLVRSAQLRSRLAQESRMLGTPLALADQTVAATRWLIQNPQWPLGALVVWIVFRPRRALRWAARLSWLWVVGRRVRRILMLAPRLNR